MTLKLERLTTAMAEHEGWSPVGSQEAPTGSRAYRNHNPGNLRSSPFAFEVVDGYAVFKNDFIGWNAFQYDIVQKAKGNTSTGLNGQSTIRDLITKWAPSTDGNNTEAYIQAVVAASGLPESTKLQELLQ